MKFDGNRHESVLAVISTSEVNKRKRYLVATKYQYDLPDEINQ